jgi:hypothetical protein
MGHSERYSTLTDVRHGFQIKRSCETQLITTTQELTREISDSHQIDVFAKAFDI